MKNIFNKIVIISLLLISVSCRKKTVAPEEVPNTVTPTENLIKIGETYILGANAKAYLYSDKNLETGYNEIFVALFDSTDGTRLSNGHFDITPMMNMGSMIHSSPVENTEDTMTTNGYFRSAVVFSMAGTALEWSLNLSFHNHKNEKNGIGSIGVNVIASSPVKFKSTVLTLDSNSKVFITLIKPTKPLVGINDIEFVLHKKTGMMTYPSIDNYTIEIEPYMPSMGHGSPGNINPINSGQGHYLGKVNFTMSGLWNVKIKLYKAGVLISDDQYFEMTL